MNKKDHCPTCPLVPRNGRRVYHLGKKKVYLGNSKRLRHKFKTLLQKGPMLNRLKIGYLHQG